MSWVWWKCSKIFVDICPKCKKFKIRSCQWWLKVSFLFCISTLLVVCGFFSLQKLWRMRKHQYKILSQRIDREKKMFVITQKIQTRKDLQVMRACVWVYFITALSRFCLCFCQKKKQKHQDLSFYSVHQDKNKKVKVKKETTDAAAIYKFEAKRKRWERTNSSCSSGIANFANKTLVE